LEARSLEYFWVKGDIKMKVQVIAVVNVDPSCVERPANMTEQRHRERVAEAMEIVLKENLKDNGAHVDFVTVLPVLDKTDSFFVGRNEDEV
jgi:hypothetical protein